MAKAIPKISSRRVGRIGSRKSTRKIPKGVIHIQASFNNTIVVSWSSAGRGPSSPRSPALSSLPPPFFPPAALRPTSSGKDPSCKYISGNLAEVMIKGPGLGRDAALRAIRRSDILLTFVRDVTPMPHNGCKLPKKKFF
uniref:Small ribosomal subunit protein uS11c n=1 Tax=Sonchus arvensis TaxID=50192 RepID=A0A1U8YIE6_SONAR|nr:ribosomal protein S11 [Sonchus arvensis]